MEATTEDTEGAEERLTELGVGIVCGVAGVRTVVGGRGAVGFGSETDLHPHYMRRGGRGVCQTLHQANPATHAAAVVHAVHIARTARVSSHHVAGAIRCGLVRIGPSGRWSEASQWPSLLARGLLQPR